MIKLSSGIIHPMKMCSRFFVIGIFVSLSFSAFAQVKINGIIVDSLSFKPLTGVHIKVKNKTGGTTSDANGSFAIQSIPFDTLLFTAIGYKTLEFPVILDEEDVIILLSEDVTYLRPVIVTGAPILSPLVKEKKEYVYRRPAPAKLATGSGIAFDYFSKAQKERRKLQKLVAANEKVSAYNLVITDPNFKDDIISRYGFTDDEYYDAVLNFNLTHIASIENKEHTEVLAILDKYFCRQSNRCR